MVSSGPGVAVSVGSGVMVSVGSGDVVSVGIAVIVEVGNEVAVLVGRGVTVVVVGIEVAVPDGTVVSVELGAGAVLLILTQIEVMAGEPAVAGSTKVAQAVSKRAMITKIEKNNLGDSLRIGFLPPDLRTRIYIEKESYALHLSEMLD